MTRRVLGAFVVAAGLIAAAAPLAPASANPICSLEHCILPGICRRICPA